MLNVRNYYGYRPLIYQPGCITMIEAVIQVSIRTKTLNDMCAPSAMQFALVFLTDRPGSTHHLLDFPSSPQFLHVDLLRESHAPVPCLRRCLAPHRRRRAVPTSFSWFWLDDVPSLLMKLDKFTLSYHVYIPEPHLSICQTPSLTVWLHISPSLSNPSAASAHTAVRLHPHRQPPLPAGVAARRLHPPCASSHQLPPPPPPPTVPPPNPSSDNPYP